MSCTAQLFQLSTEQLLPFKTGNCLQDSTNACLQQHEPSACCSGARLEGLALL